MDATRARDKRDDIGAFRSWRRRVAARRGPIGLALGGGGARGIAHVGVLEALAGYPGLSPQFYAGTSAGSVIAVLAAAGLPLPQIREFAEELEWFAHVIKVSDLIVPRYRNRGGLFPNMRLRETINRRIGGRSFDELPHDVAITATDIVGRRRIIFTSHRVAQRLRRRTLERFLPPPRGHLPGTETVILSDVADVGLAVCASCAVPGFFRPVSIHTMKLVDGGLVDQTPVDIVAAMGATFSIAASLGLSFLPQKLDNALHAFGGTVGMLGLHQLRRSLESADIGFQITGIDGRSPFAVGQTDL
ncbi:MAG: patatin-like phospholipase family protein, partial [Spirochaetales bacterium]|nr:patatin-like phospholipase family protein [Spirochaetales bacterium]